MAKKVVVLGASGLVGQYTIRHLPKDWKVTGTFFKNNKPGLVHLNVLDKAKLFNFLREYEPEVIINATNLRGGVDFCERNQEIAHRFYLGITKNLLQRCRETGSKLVHISTDYIFDGSSGPYDEEATSNPINSYGKVKSVCENEIRGNLDNYLIIRTTFVYDWDPDSRTKNFIMSLIERMGSGQVVKVPPDQIGNPTVADNLGQAIGELVRKDLCGVFNISGSERMSKYEWAIKAANEFNLDSSKIVTVDSEQLGQIAKRPKSAGFILDKARRVLETELISTSEGLNRMKMHMNKWRRREEQLW